MSEKVKTFLVLNFLLLSGYSSILKVQCTTSNCDAACGSNACIKYGIPDVSFSFQKCRNTADCTGITSQQYSLSGCSGTWDPTNTVQCSNQCCYFNSALAFRRDVCLTPQAIGLVNSEYKGVCDRASRNIYSEISQLQQKDASLEEKINYNDSRSFGVGLASLIISSILSLISLGAMIYFKCKKGKQLGNSVIDQKPTQIIIQP